MPGVNLKVQRTQFPSCSSLNFYTWWLIRGVTSLVLVILGHCQNPIRSFSSRCLESILTTRPCITAQLDGLSQVSTAVRRLFRIFFTASHWSTRMPNSNSSLFETGPRTTLSLASMFNKKHQTRAIVALPMSSWPRWPCEASWATT